MAAPLRSRARRQGQGQGQALSADDLTGADPLADWDLAARVAWRIAGSGDRVSATDVDALRMDVAATVARADGLARAATGLGADLSPASAEVIGRRAWIRSNLATVAWLTDPLAAKLSRPPGSRTIARTVLGVQLGTVFGYLATKVLGQYEVLRPGGQTTGRLILVGPNLLAFERSTLREVGLEPGEFRLGVILHELAHRLQFEAVPWTRPYLQGLLDRYLDETRFDAEQLKQVLGRLIDVVRDPGSLSDARALLQIVLTPEQATTITRAQSLMTLFEGHGNVVMEWGAELAGDELDPARVRTALAARRSRPTDRALRSLLGLSMKAEQYRVGEAWILEVVERHGREVFDRVWGSPMAVPTDAELSDSEAWVARVTA